MSAATGPSPEFIQWVRNALAHLYDSAYLQGCPLSAICFPRRDHDSVTRAQALRRQLLECLEDLAPRGKNQAPAGAARGSAILAYRYLDGLTIEEIAREMAISPRQAYREHDRGVKAVAVLLHDRLTQQGAEGEEVPPGGPVDQPQGRLELARAEAERLRSEVHRERLGLHGLLADVIAIVTPLAEQRGVAMDGPPDRPPITVLADRALLRQALLAVLTRALSGPGPAQLAWCASRQPGRVTLDVRRGPEHALMRFDHLPATALDVELTVAAQLVVAQGGELLLHQGENAWAGRIILPATGRPTILVIDDNADLLALVQRYLGGHDVAVVGTTEAMKGLPLALEVEPQAVLLDLMMPVQDGWGVLRALREEPRTQSIPVIVCSVLDQRPLAAAMGASDYLTKPLSQTELMAVLRQWLGVLPPRA